MKGFMTSIMSPELQAKAKKGFGLDLRKVISDAQSSGEELRRPDDPELGPVHPDPRQGAQWLRRNHRCGLRQCHAD
ncbi:hypothetical protein G6F56_014483 [Rhizopus delemar]|nr:hypothetical protein G6F56_014483 [Rhizopus delemar]